MTETLILPARKVDCANQQAPLQEVGQRFDVEEHEAQTNWFIFNEPKPYKHYATRLSLDPGKWDYPPEEDCERDWKALGG